MPQRGSYDFEVSASGALADNDSNLEKLRKLFRDERIIGGKWGPGAPGDFDHGSWHILCHLAAGAGVLVDGGTRSWVGITHDPARDTYEASIAVRENGSMRTVPLASGDARAMVGRSSCVGFVEGSSEGHIAARGARDPADAFNGWPRQDYDRDVSDRRDGGTVWEHWSTTRDIRPSSKIGMHVLRAYLGLVSVLGGRFVAAVARGRRDHDHPIHLVALVRAGVLTEGEATWDVTPQPIAKPVQDLLYEARPKDSLAAVDKLPFTPGDQKYFMFERRIDRWSKASQVKQDLGI